MTMDERLQAISLDRGEDGEKKRMPKADTLATLLTQGLQSNNNRILCVRTAVHHNNSNNNNNDNNNNNNNDNRILCVRTAVHHHNNNNNNNNNDNRILCTYATTPGADGNTAVCAVLISL